MMEPAQFWSTGDYAIVGDLWSSPGRDLAAALPVQDQDVIDLATGTGVTAIAMANRGARSVVGVDVTPTLLAEARRRAQAEGIDITWIEADMLSVPISSGSADLVTSTFGIIFAAAPDAALAEAHRLTRSGGSIVFTSWSDSGLFGRIRQALAPFFPDTPEPWHAHPDTIKSVAGSEADVTEQAFTMTIRTPVHFIDLLHQHSAPIILGARALGYAWPVARARLIDIVRTSGEEYHGTFRVPVTYLVTTLRK
jgi:SAM-dependent methyltransferase